MNTARKIAKNTGASLLTQVSTPVSSFVLVFFIARFLGPSGLGAYSSAFSLLFIFQAFASLGFSYLVTREVSQDKSKASKFLINASFIGVVFSVIFGGIMCLTIHLITPNRETILAVYILSASLVPYTIALVCQSICNAYEKLGYVAVSQISGNTFKMVLGTIILFKGYGIVPLMVVILAGHCIMTSISLRQVAKLINNPFHEILKIDLDFCRWILASTPVFALIMILSSIRLNIDVLILNGMLGENDVGLYSAANKLVNIFKLGISCYIMAMQPVIFRVFLSSSDKFKEICTGSVRYLFMLFIPITVMTVVLSERIIRWVFKEAFLPSAEVLSILIWLLLFYGLNQIFANALVSSNNQKVNLIGNVIGMVVNILLNLMLIPNYRYVGAAISSVVSAIAALLYQQYFVSRYLFNIKYFSAYKKPLVAAVAMGAIAYSLRNMNIFMMVSVSAVTFFLLMLALGAFTQQDKHLLRKLWTGERDPEGATRN